MKNRNALYIFFYSFIILQSTNSFCLDACQFVSTQNIHYLIIDPLNRMTGYKLSEGKKYNEIPGACYEDAGIDQPDYHEFITAANNPFINGKYQIYIYGIEKGYYQIWFSIKRNNKVTSLQTKGVIDSGGISYYKLKYNTNPDSSITFEHTIHTCSELRQDLDICYELKDISNKGIYNSLSKKVDNAEKQEEKGKYNTAINHINAFINEVEAQRGKHVREDAADILIEDAEALIKFYQKQ